MGFVLAFTVDILTHVNELNGKLQRKDQSVHEMHINEPSKPSSLYSQSQKSHSKGSIKFPSGRYRSYRNVYGTSFWYPTLPITRLHAVRSKVATRAVMRFKKINKLIAHFFNRIAIKKIVFLPKTKSKLETVYFRYYSLTVHWIISKGEFHRVKLVELATLPAVLSASFDGCV